MNLLKLVTIVMSILVASLPSTYATTIGIYFGSFSVFTDLPRLVDGLDQGQITVEQNNPPFGLDYTVQVSLKNTTSQQLTTLQLFSCGNLNPQTCTSTVTPQIYQFQNSELDLQLSWNDLRDQSIYPQTANLLFVVQTSNTYGGSWLTSWHRLVRTGTGFNPPYHFTQDPDTVSVFTPTIEDRNAVKAFIDLYGMIPFTDSDSVQFSGATAIHRITLPDFTPTLLSGDTITSLPQDALVFPVAGEVRNGIALVNNPVDFLCGGDANQDGNLCDAGETASNCCSDCGCPTGQYCHSGLGCQLSSGISLSVIPPTTTLVANCNQDNFVTVTLRMNNPPSDLSILTQFYTIDGDQTFGIGCAANDDIYSCQIRVPLDLQCDAGSFLYADNSISFGIQYPDGAGTVVETLTVAFPDITVGSWTCGDQVCDSQLGETSGNCCYDCGCASGVCDRAPGSELDSGVCTTAPSGLQITGVTPTSIGTHSPTGNQVSFSYTIPVTLQTLTQQTEQCSATCTTNSIECTATCSVACTASGFLSVPPTISFTGDCELTFSIDDYNQDQSYTVTPVLEVPVSYQDGPTTVNEILTGQLPRYSFGPFFCGDFTCNDPVETTANCCYDCGCGDGNFCNTVNPNQPSPGDVCVADAVDVVVDEVSSTDFVDHSVFHIFNITAHLTQQPMGFEVFDTDCRLGDGLIPCTLSCTSLLAENFTCEVRVPAITYYLSPFFDGTQLLLDNNALEFEVGYNDGPDITLTVLDVALPNITIIPVAHCGFDACEAGLGETITNCCIDCGCGDGQICVPGGFNPESACILPSDIQAFLTEINPDPFGCDIQHPHIGGGGIFVKGLEFIINITNPPGDLSLVDVIAELDGEEINTNCFLNEGTVRCHYFMDAIEGDSAFGGGNLTPENITKHISFTLSTTYVDNTNLINQQFRVEGDFQLEIRKSEALLTCEQQKSSLSDRLDDYKDKSTLIKVIFGGLVALTIAICICSKTPGCGWNLGTEKVCKIGILVTSCTGAILIPLLGQVEQQIDEISIEKDAICAAPDTNSLRGATDSMGQIGYLVGGMISGMVCAISIGGAMGGNGGTASAGVEGTTVITIAPDGAVTVVVTPAASAPATPALSGTGFIRPPSNTIITPPAI